MMISIKEAIQIIEQTAVPTVLSENKKLEDALGCTLYEAVASPIYMPPFRQSAMDGYALHLHDSPNYRLIGEVKAGDSLQPQLNPGDAVQIFTGAAVPASANAVVMQEKVSATENTITIEGAVGPNANIRPKGEQVAKGAIALHKGTLITPAGIGFLASLGITSIEVYKKPTIAIVTTGNELVPAGRPLEQGQIYESNSAMLAAALRDQGCSEISIRKVEDDYHKTVHLLEDTLSNHDVVLITGGISVGDYDFVGKALHEIGVQQLFYKVKQKPGKPLFFGKSKETLVFALPGNPAAALTCFHIYVRTALEKRSGNMDFSLIRTQEKLTANFLRKGDRPQFLKANYAKGEVTILDGQSSAMQQTFALANALVFAPQEVTDMKKGDEVEVIHL